MMQIRGAFGPAALLALAIGAVPGPARAQDTETAGDPPIQGPQIQWQSGPITARLADQAQIEVAQGYLFAGADDTRRLLAAGGNIPSGDELGLVSPAAEDATWFLVFEYEATGHVDDEDRAEIDAEALFQQISEGTEEANKVRKEQGFAQLHLTGWTESPHYDPSSNDLVWALEAQDDGGDKVVNYNVRVLGREGVTSVTLVADPKDFAALKPEVERLLGGFEYLDGKRYADFRSGDKLAGYGLTALVAGGAGVAAAKLGLFSKLGKFLVAGWKLIALGVVALGTAVKKLFNRRSSDFQPPPPPMASAR